MKGKYLITTNEWFYAPDGKQYRAVWGEVELLQTKDVLGVEPNRVTANWTLRVGTEEDHILIGGCQINYSVKCENKPNTKAVEQVIQGEKKVDVPVIYIPGELVAKDPVLIISEKGGDAGRIAEMETGIRRIVDNGGNFEKAKNLLDEMMRVGVEDFNFKRYPYDRYESIIIKWAGGKETVEKL